MTYVEGRLSQLDEWSRSCHLAEDYQEFGLFVFSPRGHGMPPKDGWILRQSDNEMVFCCTYHTAFGKNDYPRDEEDMRQIMKHLKDVVLYNRERFLK